MRLAAACVLAVLASAAVASAAIVPQRGIAGVRLEMTKAQVRAVLGAPRRAVHGSNEFGSFTVYRYRGLRVTFQGSRTVTAILTTSTGERTGVRRWRRLERRAGPGEGGGRPLPHRRVTDFRIRRGRVTSVQVGFVLD